MALKTKNKKKQQASVQKSKPWLDLPNQLVNTIELHPNLNRNISFGGIMKSWRTTSKHCNANADYYSKLPWLQLYESDGANIEKYRSYIAQRGTFATSFSKMTQSFWRKDLSFVKLPRYPCKHYVGCSNGILVAEIEPLHRYYLCNPTLREILRLPLWDPEVPIKLAALSSPPEDPNCTVMVLTGISDPAFGFCKLEETSRVAKWRWSKFWSTVEPENQWTMQDCTFTEQFANAIGFKGKFYVLTVQGSLVVIENIGGSVPKVMDVSSTRNIVPSVSSKHFREYLLESEGEVLLVFLISRKSSVHCVDCVEVYQLNMGSKLCWVKMETLGERAVFVGSNCSVSVLASEVGCRKNNIYFKHDAVADEWCAYDMEFGSISQGWSEANSTTSAIGLNR